MSDHSEPMMRRLGRHLPLINLVGINLLLLLVALLAPSPGNAWYKGPLIDPVSPYTPALATRLLALGGLALLDLGLLLGFVAFRLGRRPGWRPGRLLRAVALLAAPLLALALVEGGMRLYLDARTATMFMPDPDYNWTLVPNLDNYLNEPGGERVTTNSHGWRGQELPRAKAVGELRVLLLGDSSAYGLGVKEADSFIMVLERALQGGAPVRPVRGINAACPGYTTHQGLKRLAESAAMVQPDLVLVAFNNDPAPEFYTDSQREPASAVAAALKPLLFRSRLYIVARQVAIGWLRGHLLVWTEDMAGGSRIDPAARPTRERVPRDEYRRNLRAMAALAQEGGYRLIFVNMPVNFSEKAHLRKFYRPAYPAALRQEAERLGVPLVDVHGRWASQGEWSFLPGHLFHPDARGHGRIGGQLAERIHELGWFQSRQEIER